MEKRDRMPDHPVPASAAALAARPRLTVDGLVSKPLELAPADLAGLARGTFTEAFKCEEGWEVPGLMWEGVKLAEVLRLAGVLPEARWVRGG